MQGYINGETSSPETDQAVRLVQTCLGTEMQVGCNAAGLSCILARKRECLIFKVHNHIAAVLSDY